MANADVVFGFRPVKMGNGSPYNGQATTYYKAAGDATDLAVGDIVKHAGSADAAGNYGSITAITAVTDTPIGVVVGFRPNYANLSNSTYSPASTEAWVRVCDAKDVIFEAQLDSATDITAADIGLNIDPEIGAQDATKQTSGFELDESDLNTTNSLMFTIVGLVNRPDNEGPDGTSTHAKALVRWNEHLYGFVVTAA